MDRLPAPVRETHAPPSWSPHRGKAQARCKHRTALGALLWTVVAGGCGQPPDPVAPLPGEALAGLSTGERGRFLLGRALFERVATADEGLGPLYNEVRCSDCHDRPAVGGSGAYRARILKATRYVDGRCDLLRHEGGDNIQRRVTELTAARGMGPEAVPPSATDTTRMMAPSLLGIGLADAVPEAELRRRADPLDRDGDGISGRLPLGADGRGARFGRKGDAVTLTDFVDAALRFELGFTTPAHPTEETRNGERVPEEADPAPDPEIDRVALGQLADYVRFLAPPAREEFGRAGRRVFPLVAAAEDSVARGRALFVQIGCAGCHTEELRTGPSPFPALAHRSFRPYSDYLLHDMGPGLASICGVDASPRELRTAPLWGLRHRTRLLHDGRATSVDGAIIAHGGEALGVLRAYQALGIHGQRDILRFLASL